MIRLCDELLLVCDARYDHFKAVVQLLMSSMAVCDIGMVTIAWILFAVAALYDGWMFGTFMCRLLSYAQAMTGDSSMWAIAVVSIDRLLDSKLNKFIAFAR